MSSLTKQGIVTILPSSSDHITTTNKQSSTLRRTLSADMSSLKLLNQNAPIIKKISSHHQIANMIIPNSPSNSSSSSEEEDHENRPGTDEIWRSIQSQKLIKKESSSADDWGSAILTQKSTSDLPPPIPYIHPLVKKSSNTLSVKSLQICTENLGSETGSDGFYPSSKNDEDINNKEKDQTKEIKNLFEAADMHVVKCNNKVTSPVRPFPPPLPSIDGSASLQMQSHRKDGRLVVEAVSVPPRNYFHSNRTNGRLVLTFIKNEEIDEDEGDDIETVKEEVVRSLPNEKINISTIVQMKKNPNPMSIKKFNKTFNMMEANEEISVPHSLPMPPRVPRMIPTSPPCAKTTFNTYNYFWRNTNNNTVSAGGIMNYANNNTKQYLPNQKKYSYENDQDLVVMRKNKTEYFVPYLKGCKEGRRRSVSIWEPYCIATS